MENRESFFARLSPFMPPPELRNVEVAYMMAKFAHRAQKRNETDSQGEKIRYFEHLRRVAIILIDETEIRDWTLICAALLHDSLEDTRDINPEMIAHLFGTRVCQIVKLLSKCPKEGYFERLQKYGDDDVFLIKAADRLDNLRSMEQAGLLFMEKQHKETVERIVPILRQSTNNKVNHLCWKIVSTSAEVADKIFLLRSTL